jgi:hypothetical protein
MRKMVFAIALFLLVPALRAQQASPTDVQLPAGPSSEPQAAPQAAAQNPNAQSQLPADIRPGHPLDPADVDVLTGKRDRELETARRNAVPAIAGAYGESGNYGDYFLMNGRLGDRWDIPMLPLSRISDPFFFGFGGGGFGRGGFGRGGFRGGR